MKPSSTNCSAALTNSMASGSRVRSSAMTSSFTQSVPSASRASCAVSTASAAPRQPAVLGSGVMPSRLQQIEHAGAAFGVDAAHRDRGQLGARGDQRLLQHRQILRAAGAHDQPRAELATAQIGQPVEPSATLHRRHHFHPRPVGQRCMPFRPGQHRPVHRHRDALRPESQGIPAAPRRSSARRPRLPRR